MRFIEKGPDIPDELLTARDQGRVVFFCGAGVSRAKAGIADFIELSKKVVSNLGSANDSHARKILSKIDKEEIPGLISPDKVFSELNKEFFKEDIEGVVAENIKPEMKVDLSAHKIILELAKYEGKTKLITTNFDLLFEKANQKLVSYNLSQLPDPNNADEFNGIIHIHGKVDGQYTRALDGGFVLSTPEFGKAYLAEGWATKFILSVLEKYIVVFIGYRADDPLVQYLLEGLNQADSPINKAYAFQFGDDGIANDSWAFKGVKPINYVADENDGHDNLWATLEKWAGRSENIKRWYNKCLEKALKGPRALKAYERGQIAHIVSTTEGAKYMCEAKKPIPSEWLFVFDDKIRYGKPSFKQGTPFQPPKIDPLYYYCIDSDIPSSFIGIDNDLEMDTENLSSDDFFEDDRVVPSDAWSAFKDTVQDMKDYQIDNLPSIFEDRTETLPKRYQYIQYWLNRVSHEDEFIWWLSKQTSINENYLSIIDQKQNKENPENVIKYITYLRLIFEDLRKSSSHHDYHRLEHRIRDAGWDNQSIRVLSEILKPRLRVNTQFTRELPPTLDETRDGLVRFEINFPDIPGEINIPEEQLSYFLRLTKENILLSLSYEEELNISVTSLLDSIVNIQDYGFEYLLKIYIEHLEKLIKYDVELANFELASWPNTKITKQLEAWSLQFSELHTNKSFTHLVLELSSDSFWYDCEEELLHSIKVRANSLNSQQLTKLSKRILSGPDKNQSDKEKHEKYKAYKILKWSHELQGTLLEIDKKALDKYKRVLPGWNPDNYGRSDMAHVVKQDTVCEQLLNIDLNSIIDRAKEIKEQDNRIYVEAEPFRGLVKERPRRALLALLAHAKSDRFDSWAWNDFFSVFKTHKELNRFLILINGRLSKFSDKHLGEIVYSISTWLKDISKEDIYDVEEHYYSLWDVVLKACRKNKKLATAIVRRNKKVDWIMESINSPVGKYAQSLFNHPSIKDNNSLDEMILEKIDKILDKRNIYYQYAYVVLSHSMNWLYSKNISWTKDRFINKLGDEDYSDPIWSGIVWGGTIPQLDLYNDLVQHADDIIRNKTELSENMTNYMSAFIISGWVSTDNEGNKLLSNLHARNLLINCNEKIRSRVLWHIDRWLSKKEQSKVRLLSEQIEVFFLEVWPKQKSAYNEKNTVLLCNIFIHHMNHLNGYISTILKLVKKLPNKRFPDVYYSRANHINDFPKEHLSIFYKLLPQDANFWPYNFGGTLKKIIDANPDLLHDEMFIELQRKWDSR